jgi:hypothetical protein
MFVIIITVGVAAAENDHGQQQEREPGTCQGTPYSHFCLQHLTRKDENHDSELTDIEISLLREPWQLESWDLQQAITVMLHGAATVVVLSPYGSIQTQAGARDAATGVVVTDAML